MRRKGKCGRKELEEEEEQEEAENIIKKEREEREEGSLSYLKGREHMYHPVLHDFQAALSLSLPPSLSLSLSLVRVWPGYLGPGNE